MFKPRCATARWRAKFSRKPIFVQKDVPMLSTATAAALAARPRPPISNLQLHLLKLYAAGVSEEDLRAIQRMIARYFAEKASIEARKVWDEKGYTEEQMLQENMRTAYKSVAQ
jgi:hypothetical protein